LIDDGSKILLLKITDSEGRFFIYKKSKKGEVKKFPEELRKEFEGQLNKSLG
jgi:hypothetical protein